MTDYPQAGGCLCGAVRYEITAPPKHVSHCHCTMCRRISGAVALTWVYCRTEDLRLTKGEPAKYASSAEGERHFCRDCGSTLFFYYRQTADMIDVALGSLDHPEEFPASHHNFIGTKLPWLHLDEDLPIYEGMTPES